jgi:DNA-binding transcriptional ArsR family regulator
VFMNTTTNKSEKSIAEYLKVLGSPFRVQLLFSIGYGEACVCHLEALLKKRQAYISQHLMVLRDAGILETRRDGKYIYYRVADNKIFGLIEAAADLLEITPDSLPPLEETRTLSNCECPKCQSTILSIKTE